LTNPSNSPSNCPSRGHLYSAGRVDHEVDANHARGHLYPTGPVDREVVGANYAWVQMYSAGPVDRDAEYSSSMTWLRLRLDPQH
jgi:hypothetical protein